MSTRATIVAISVLTGGLLVLMATAPQREPSEALPPPAHTLAMMPSTPEPTPGWWATVPFTGTPDLAKLPGLPEVNLAGNAASAAGAPVAFGVVSCPRADVTISAVTVAGAPARPAGRSPVWNIFGSAAIPDLSYWKGEIAAASLGSADDSGRGWTLLYRSNVAVGEGLLIEFHTGTVPRGDYLIRLMAVDGTGNYPQPCVISVSTR